MVECFLDGVSKMRFVKIDKRLTLRKKFMPPAYEDLTDYTEEDPNNYLSITSDRVSFNLFDTNATKTYLYKDFGIDYFNGDFTIDFDFNLTNLPGNYTFIAAVMLTNTIGDYRSVITANGQAIVADFYEDGLIVSPRRQVREWDDVSQWISENSPAFTIGTTYYASFIRDESAGGANGVLYLKTYSDPERTNLVDTRTLTLNNKRDFRYMMVCASDSGWEYGDPHSGYFENYKIKL